MKQEKLCSCISASLCKQGETKVSRDEVGGSNFKKETSCGIQKLFWKEKNMEKKLGTKINSYMKHKHTSRKNTQAHKNKEILKKNQTT